MALKALLYELPNIWQWKPWENHIAVSIPDPSDILHLKGAIMAPEGCPMEGYIYFLDVKYPTDYPFKPPKVQFETPVWLANVNSSTGGICGIAALDLAGWCPTGGIRPGLDTILVSIQALFKVVTIDSSQNYANESAANQLQTDPDAFKKQAKEWAEKHNEGYGIATLEDYFVSGIQSLLKVTQPRPIIRYELRAYCKKVSSQLWKAVIVVFPHVEIFKKAINLLYSDRFIKLTGHEFDFSDDVMTVGNGDEDSLDMCWRIIISNATIQKEDVDKFDAPHKHHPVICQLDLKWVREDRVPHRLMHRLKVSGARDPFNSFTICVEPSSYPDTLTSRKPTLSQLLNLPIRDNPRESICLITQIGARYSKFGDLLLNDSTGNVVEGITVDKHVHDYEAINQEIFRRWLNGEGRQPATWETLIQALSDAQLYELATIIQRNC